MASAIYLSLSTTSISGPIPPQSSAHYNYFVLTHDFHMFHTDIGDMDDVALWKALLQWSDTQGSCLKPQAPGPHYPSNEPTVVYTKFENHQSP